MKSLEDAESQAREIKKMTENAAAVNLTRQRQPSQLTQFGEDTPKKEEKVGTNWVAKHVFNVGEITHILEITQ